jgi:uncharacterized protein HemX
MNISQNSTLSISLAIVFITAIVGASVYAAIIDQQVQMHHADKSLHWSGTDRKVITEMAVDLKYLRAEVADMKASLRALEKRK